MGMVWGFSFVIDVCINVRPKTVLKGLVSIPNGVASAVGVGAGERLEEDLVRLQHFAEEGCDHSFVGKLDLLCGAGGGRYWGVWSLVSGVAC